ncbi:Succinyl-CoA ligase (ADP-forming) beta chain [Anaerovibrio sp. JC8]|uniref:ADP-forming succinate--CoA ligase subunit beta n=1 Tax=Anaerovibrio sp. JC8 TaxID=1240085 RepID=UPI000A0E7934|nr:ADP-forming succinate--CoA ligase subunit beta [Anaerovibrio sp. JC8]ORU00975.1 Succinyl-CoA ligase (ADP-forming) beta chain [Anaerovibrio sp. JC8]
MNIHEYQSKEVLRQFGVNVPNGKPAFTVEEAVEAAKALGSKVTVVKAQIHAGGRGKAGGVKIAKNLDEVKAYATELLGKILVTHQTGPDGKKVNRLLIEEGSNIAKEYYLSFVNDRSTAKIVMIGSEEGGMEIEKVAAESPDKIIKEYIDPAIGLAPFQATRMAYKMNFKPEAIKKATATMIKLYNAFIGKDCSQVEINPLVVTAEDDVICLDAKLNFDDSGLFRHPDIVELRDETEEDPKELWASNEGLNYVNLGGDVACMVNGAGLAMATVDILKYYGGEPANFLDVGGSSTPEKIATAFEIMLDGGQSKGIFVNIFGGINKCDVIAEGIQKAAQIIADKTGQDGIPVPVVVRLEGTNVERGRQILTEKPVKNVFMAPTMEGGAQDIVKRVEEAKKN